MTNLLGILTPVTLWVLNARITDDLPRRLRFYVKVMSYFELFMARIQRAYRDIGMRFIIFTW
jgi:hypothetical protein